MIKINSQLIIKFMSFFVALFLVGCNSLTYNQTEGNVADSKQRLSAAKASMDNLTKPTPPLLIKDSMYVDTTPISLDTQPEWLKNTIAINGQQLPFSYFTRLVTDGAGKGVVSKNQQGLDEKLLLSINYTGTVKGALDTLAAKSGYVYTIKHGNTIYWQAFITRTYSVAFMPGTADYVMGQTSGGSGGTDSASGEYSNFKGASLSVWKDVEDTVKQLLTADGKVVVSQSSTSLTVRDKPTNVELVGQYVRNLNKNLSQQVFVKIDVIDVSLTNDYNWGINWQVLESAFAHSNFSLVANMGEPVKIAPLSGTIPTYGLGPDNATQKLFNAGGTSLLSAVIKALTQQGKVSIVAQPRVVAMNNQVSAIRIVNTEQYIASVQNTSVPSTGSSSGSQTVNNVSTITSQVTPGTLTTGLTMFVLPKILGEKVYIQVNVDLSQNQGIQTLCAQSGTTAGSCADASFVIQSPHVTEKMFNQRSVLTSGETLVLSGLRQIQNQTGAMQLFNIQEIGGKASTQTNNDTVILVTPFILHTHETG